MSNDAKATKGGDRFDLLTAEQPCGGIAGEGKHIAHGAVVQCRRRQDKQRSRLNRCRCWR